jgi:hypothetical protein
MRYLVMGLVFVVANAVLSLLTVLVWRSIRSARPGGDLIFSMRMLPAAGSALLVSGIVVPGYWAFEPRATAETPGPVLLAFVLVAGVLVASGLRRAAQSWIDTRRLERRWTSSAIGGPSAALPIPTYSVHGDIPLAALVGVVRPRLFVSERFMGDLSPGERQAVIAHETGHLRSFDNLKRTLMRFAPDWLSLSRGGEELERAWIVAAEEAADDHAAGADRMRSLDLASALLKASRFGPAHIATVSNFCDESTLVHRVERLLDDAPSVSRNARGIAPRLAGLLVLVVTMGLLMGPALRASYAMTEAAVRLLR